MIALAYIFCSVSAGKNEIGVCAQMLPAFVADKRFDKFSPALFYPGWVKKGLKPTRGGGWCVSGGAAEAAAAGSG